MSEAPDETVRRYRPADFTRTAPHVRDHNSVARIMRMVLLSLVPIVGFGLYNTGVQIAKVATSAGIDVAAGWRAALLTSLGLQADPGSPSAMFVLGLTYFLPVYATAGVVASAWQWLFATFRRREPAAGLGVVVLLFVLCLPPTITYWKVAVGISFGVVIGREIFGGTGKNFLNPALVGFAFLYFAYPDAMRSAWVWVPVDGWSGATPLAAAVASGKGALSGLDISWSTAFVGDRPGAFGETSALACVLGAGFLLAQRLVSWRILAGALLGLGVTSTVFQSLSAGSFPLADLPWYWHATLGSFAFGLVYFATDPVTAPVTSHGKWVYGLLIGFFTVLIRVANPVHTEGVMLAVLFGNTTAPLIDYFVVAMNRRTRIRRRG